MLTPNAELMRQARQVLKGKWTPAVVGNLIFLVVTAGVQAIPVVGYIAPLIITGPMLLGLSLFFLSFSRGQEVPLSRIFDGFQRFVDALITYLLMVLFIFLWSLLLIVPGIIAALSYALTFFLMADRPELKGMEALNESRRLMKGNRWKLFCLFLRFIGWFLLGALTMGIAYLWVMPYLQTAAARFYDDILGGGESAAETSPRPSSPIPSGPPPKGPRAGTVPTPPAPAPPAEPPRPAVPPRARLCLSCHNPILDPRAVACPECGFPLMEVPGSPVAGEPASSSPAPAPGPHPQETGSPAPAPQDAPPPPEPMDLEATVMVGPPRLTSLSPEGRTETFELRLPVMKIGRKSDNDLTFPEEKTISGRHCEIYREGKELFIKDLGSTNGVLVNGRKVQVIQLKEEDEIKLGNKIFKFTKSL